ncbi:hypothetical protein [Erwinia tasmaniensis]|uniref:hypothetical protein n=1 Tax=Erwinia tasmaniensis TaxID=338565 RepID=UPI0005B408AA|nr:hypothetical protein [Erwinia tasmaniensis]
MTLLTTALTEISSIYDLNLHGLLLSITTDGVTGKTTLDLEKGSGCTGYWKLDAKRKIDRVVLRIKQQDGSYLVYTGLLTAQKALKAVRGKSS